MTDHEKELIHIIRNASDPEGALKTAINIILGFLQQPESSPRPAPDSLQESA